MWSIRRGTIGGSSPGVVESMDVVQAAADFWGLYIDFGAAVMNVEVNFVSLAATTLAQASTPFFSVGGGDFQASTIIELQTGFDPTSINPDITIDINIDFLIANDFSFGVLDDHDVPNGKIDLFSVIVHEIGHGLGFVSFFDIPETNVFDTFVSGLPTSPVFTGPLAMAAFGGSIPLADDPSHIAQSVPDFIMRPSTSPGIREYLSETELRILQDIGLPVLGPTAGDDSLFGFYHNDTLSLGSGNDFYDGFRGNDSSFGDAGNDTIDGGVGNDTLSGGADDDELSGGVGDDSLMGDAGDDLLRGGLGADILDGGSGIDTAIYDDAGFSVTVRLWNGTGSGSIAAGDILTSIENVTGTNADDALIGSNGVGNVLDGRGGNDFIFGLSGGDLLLGGDGNDNINGGIGADSLEGGDGADILEGGADADMLFGDPGNDLLRGGLGADNLDGGAGIDTADYSSALGGVTVRLWNGTGSGNDAEGDTFTNIDIVVGSSFNDGLVGSDGVGDTLSGGGGNDFIFGLTGDDLLLGGAGADLLDGGAGVDTADYSSALGGVTVRLWNGTGSGNDAEGDSLTGIENITGSSFGDALIGANAADNVLSGGGGNDFLFGLSGDDTLSGGLGADGLDGGAGVDTADYSDASGAVTVRLWNGTGAGSDAAGDSLTSIENITGSSFNDGLLGANGVDNVLSGGGGNDFLFGLTGDDTFVFAFGDDMDTIGDFTVGMSTDDVIALSGFGAAFNTFTEVFNAATESGGTTTIDFGNGDMLILTGVAKADLHQDDFLFI